MAEIGDVVILDGGLGQALFKAGGCRNNTLWSAQALLEAPDSVRDAHSAFIHAGARVITTNTYCVTRDRLRRAGAAEHFTGMLETACRLAIEARAAAGVPGVRIAGSLPPLTYSYRPDKVLPVDQARAEYAELAELMAPHVDILLAETMSTPDEARAALEGASGKGRPVWVAWTLADGREAELRDGSSLDDAVARLAGLSPDALLVNCCAPETVAPALRRLRALTERPIGAFANGFTPIPPDWTPKSLETIGARTDLGPEAYADFARQWHAAGARIIGGCCEIGPAHIARLAQVLAG